MFVFCVRCECVRFVYRYVYVLCLSLPFRKQPLHWHFFDVSFSTYLSSDNRVVYVTSSYKIAVEKGFLVLQLVQISMRKQM